MTAGVRELAAAAGTPGFLRQQRARHGEGVVRVALFLAAAVAVLTTAAIILALLVPSIEFFGTVSPVAFLTGTDWSPLFEPPSFGVIPLVTATLAITVIASLVALPLGLGSALYLSEYAPSRVRAVLKPLLEVLAGIPTVVYGFFALAFVTPVIQAVVPGESSPSAFNALSAGLVMGVMIIPTVTSLSEDAMAAIPDSLRQGAFALGSNQRQVATGVVVPAALSGIAAAFILGISRAIGETMIVTIAAGLQPNLTWNPLEFMETMTAFIASTGRGDVPTGSIEYKTIFAVGMLLFAMTFAMNVVSTRLVRRYREVYE